MSAEDLLFTLALLCVIAGNLAMFRMLAIVNAQRSEREQISVWHFTWTFKVYREYKRLQPEGPLWKVFAACVIAIPLIMLLIMVRQPV
jgi:hypothetical protein